MSPSTRKPSTPCGMSVIGAIMADTLRRSRGRAASLAHRAPGRHMGGIRRDPGGARAALGALVPSGGLAALGVDGLRRRALAGGGALDRGLAAARRAPPLDVRLRRDRG